MTIWVVRHACAGHKGDWDGPDDSRPLDPAGIDQALALADVLADEPPSELWSSPAKRCVDTLAPLAHAVGLPVEPDEALRGPDASGLLDRLETSGSGAVFCTHGEVMAPTLEVLRARGTDVVGGRSDEELLLKGSAWRLERASSGWRLDVCAPVPRIPCPRHAEPA
ncbi:MAG: phosphoglycerate mutase family protein [Acidimicrobiales bacterium]